MSTALTPDTSPRAFPLDAEPVALADERAERVYSAPPRAAFFGLFDDRAPTAFRLVGRVAVVDVMGPLDQRGGWWWDGYDSILDRAREAFGDTRADAVVLQIDSPGGVCAGNLACARALRALADETGKPLVAHADTWATSAAYALACAADRITVTDDGAVGSVGVIATVYDRTKMTADAGLDVRVVRSGNLKADPHPDVALTDASVSRVRARVMDLAQSFAGWVAERRGQTPEAVLAHQGATIYAARALETGIADAIGTLNDAINTAAELAATQRKRMDTEKQLAAIITALGAGSHEEALAAVATQKKAAEALPTVTAERDALRAEVDALKSAARERDAAEAAAKLAAERETVLAKHRARGAYTPAMEADADFAADLAPLSPEALDRVLARLPAVAPVAAVPSRPAAGGESTSAATASASAALTDEEREMCRLSGTSEEAFLAQKNRDAAKAAKNTKE